MNRVVLGLACTLAVLAPGLGCGGASAASERVDPAARGSKTTASKTAPAGPVVPVPETLALEAGRFGLTMSAEGWTWKAIRRNVTRFDWSGRPPARDQEVLYSFFIDKLDAQSTQLLPRMVGTAAANLTDGEPCPPVEQPADIVQMLGVDRIVTVCFEPSTFYGKEHRFGVMHGIVRNNALTIAVVLASDRGALVPTPSLIGARGMAPKP